MLEDLVNEPVQYNPGTIRTQSMVHGVANVDDAFLLPEYVAITSNDDSTQDDLSTWYGQSFNLDLTQKESVVELVESVEDILGWNPAEMISKESGEQLMQF